jgi:hypothetical protein
MKSLDKDEFHESQAVSIGSVVHKSLRDVQVGKVFGRTSRGTFIRTKSKWLQFLSFERFRGPLTINLHPDAGPLPGIEAGMEVEISAHHLKFPDIGWAISLQEAEIWQPKPTTGPWKTRADRQAKVLSLANEIMEHNIESGLASLLPQMLEMSARQESTKDDQPVLFSHILHLHQEMNSSGTLPFPSEVINLLVLGAGLTPSGDDFVIGLLLVFNRWRELFPNLPGLDMFNREILEAAYQKTTTLSANLIECASHGLGNERLINALDWLVSSEEEVTSPIDDLLSWGSSSGVDAFIGYAVALLFQPQVTP